VFEWPLPLYGDTTATMRIVSLDPDRFRIVVTDHIGVNGPVRSTADPTLARQRGSGIGGRSFPISHAKLISRMRP
jgi:hypothetical protein